MTVRITAATRKAEADAVGDALNSGLVQIYDGARPTDVDDALGAQVLLAEAVFAADAFPAATDDGTDASIAIAAPISDASADATGTAAWFRVTNAAGTVVHMDGTCGTSAADMILNTLSIVALGQVDINSFVYKRPQA